MAEPARRRLSYAEYLALERETDVRHQFLDGEVWAMAGGTLRHSGVAVNLTAAVADALRGTPCRAYNSDAKLRVPDTGLATYPDLAVVCGDPETHPEDPNAATNPVAIFEVLSKSTEAWDRGGKFAHYRHLASLRQYVLLDARDVRVEVFTRRTDGTWVLAEYGAGDVIRLEPPGVSIEVDALYRDLPPEPETDHA